jgi:branched-chain amino acid transport system substrate-binding protein
MSKISSCAAARAQKTPQTGGLKMQSNNSRLWLKLAVASLALMAAGHHDGARAADDVIKIGVLTDMSGVAVDEMGPGSVLAATMAAEAMGGEVAGKKIEILVGDHQQKPDVGVSVVRRWIDEEGINAVVDVPNSSVALAINNIARDANIVFMPSSSQTMELTGAQCSPNTVRFTTDVYVTSHALPSALMQGGKNKKWFLIYADNNYGRSLVENATQAITDLGGEVVGTLPHPPGNTDFSSHVLQAQASGADVIGLATYSVDLTNFLKQAAEFGLLGSGDVQFAGFVLAITNVRALGLELAQGLYAASPFYWDYNDSTREFAKQFNPRHPTGISIQEFTGGVYGSTLHYLKAVDALGSAEDGRAVVEKMKEMPVDDPLHGKGTVRVDGSVVHDILLLQVKKPEESHGEWDLFNVVDVLPGEKAFGPLNPDCPLVAKQ